MTAEIAKDMALFLAGLLVGLVGYFGRRKIERSAEQEDLELKERLLRINKELRDQNLTPQALEKLSATLLSKLSVHTSVGEAESAVRAITHSASERLVTQMEMNQTSYEEFEKADLELRQAYERLRSLLSGGSLRRLEEAQDAWVAFRKKQVLLAGGFYEGGSIQPLIHNVEAQALTEARAKDLRAQYEELVSR